MQLRVLSGIAALGGAVVAGVGFYVKKHITDGLKDGGHYKVAVDTFLSHKGIVHLLGEPVKFSNFNIGDNASNFCTGTEAQFKVPVRGIKNQGHMYVWSSRAQYQDSWNLDRLELGLENEPNKRIVIVGTLDKQM